ncbi:hypothetical protein BDN71DRAFT_1171124 [Pleurotus eryngii]|uniref:Uncharacterized protein n=1 Tax=Pleurotus eryngii TaxID=5323 RepID=A0A9P5ZQQ7_PLEER|nr:hypothetical protein BDN71DRAFT_1171124 [Pleurotus eryngii]
MYVGPLDACHWSCYLQCFSRYNECHRAYLSVRNRRTILRAFNFVMAMVYCMGHPRSILHHPWILGHQRNGRFISYFMGYRDNPRCHLELWDEYVSRESALGIRPRPVSASAIITLLRNGVSSPYLLTAKKRSWLTFMVGATSLTSS